jgi:threonine dehydrogenase-like Zn-dependent dehydrogenase
MSDNTTVVFPEPKTVRLEDRPVEAPGEGELLVETSRTVLSTGTELTVLSGEYPDGSHWDEYGEYPFTPGYCNVGEVIETGEGVGIEPGTTVASRTPHQRYVTVDAVDSTPVPASIPDEEASFFGLASIVMNGLRRGGGAWGETAAIYGLGLLGQLTARLCLFAGARAGSSSSRARGGRPRSTSTTTVTTRATS